MKLLYLTEETFNKIKTFLDTYKYDWSVEHTKVGYLVTIFY